MFGHRVAVTGLAEQLVDAACLMQAVPLLLGKHVLVSHAQPSMQPTTKEYLIIWNLHLILTLQLYFVFYIVITHKNNENNTYGNNFYIFIYLC